MSGFGEAATDASFAAFVAEHGLALKRLAYLLTGRQGDAEDVTQEALIRLYLAWARIEPEGALAYARRVVVRQAATWGRRPARREQPSGYLPEPRIEASTADIDLARAVLRLPPRQRAIVVLRYYQDLTQAEVARTLGISVGAVKSQLAAATQRLRRSLSDDARDPEGIRS